MTREELLDQALGAVRATIQRYHELDMDEPSRVMASLRAGCRSVLSLESPAGDPLTQVDIVTVAALALMLAVDIEWKIRLAKEPAA